MSKDELWNEIIKQHPTWMDNGPHFTINGIRKFFDLVYDRAYLRGHVDLMESQNMFESVFGKGLK